MVEQKATTPPADLLPRTLGLFYLLPWALSSVSPVDTSLFLGFLPFQKDLFYFKIMYMHIYVCVVCVHVSVGIHRGQRHWIPLELEVQSCEALDTRAGNWTWPPAGAASFTAELQALLWFLQAGLCRTQSWVLCSMHFLGGQKSQGMEAHPHTFHHHIAKSS